MKLTVLGCYAATPRTISNPTSLVLEINNELFLIDCGEGTQVELRRNKVKFERIRHIFISHLHGDHVFGLIGLISTSTLLKRKKELHIHGPKGIKDFIMLQMRASESYTSFPLYFHELYSNHPEVIWEDNKIVVKTIPLKHRIYTNGFLFVEKQGERKLLIEEVKKYPIDVAYYNSIKKGKDAILDDGRIIPNYKLTSDPPPPRSFAYCSDTAFHPAIVPWIENVEVLYHESTFLEEHKELAASTGHSTATDAATIAKVAKVGTLVLGHYSTRYSSILAFQQQAETIFSSVRLADDGKKMLF